VTILALIGLLLGRMRHLSTSQGSRVIEALEALPDQIESALKLSDQIRAVAKKYVEAEGMLFFGRQFNFPVALEGALKMKEITYLFAEGHPSAELKHGIIALVGPDLPSVFVAPDDAVFSKNLNNIEQVKARKGPIVALTSPLTRIVQWLVRLMLRLFGVSATANLGTDSTEAELRGAIDLHAEASDEVQQAGAMLHSILDLEDVPVSDIMVHRRNAVTVNADDPPAAIVEQILGSPHTRLPLWRGEPDNIIGVVHAKALLRAVQANGGKVEGLDITTLATPPWFIPETTSLLAQLQAFRSRREHIALVVDEYGALMGIVTLEDILEEIVGGIEDEHDVAVAGMTAEADGSYRVNGLVTIRDLNRQFGWRLPDESASTIAGLVLHEARRIPEVGQVFVFHGFRFEILERQRNQIKVLRMIPPAPPDSAAPAEAAAPTDRPTS